MIGTRKARTELVADASKLDRGLKEGRSKFGQFGSAVGKVLGKVGSFLARSFDPLGRGIDLFTSQVDDVRDYERGIARMAIAQGKTNAQMASFREEVTQVSKDTGIARNEVLDGARAYQALTGDTAGADAAMRVFAETAEATGSSVADVAGASAAISQNLKIDPKDFKEALGIINMAGKAGAVEIKDSAAQLSGLAAGYKRFAGGTGMNALRQLSAAQQVVQKNFGNSAAEGATGLNSLMTAIVKNAGKLEKAGVKVFSDKSHRHLKSFAAILDAIGHSKTLKDQTKLQKALGRDEAVKAYLALRDYRAEFDRLAASQEGAASIDADRAQYAESAAGKLDAAMNRLKLAAAEAFTPERIAKFAETIDKLVGPVGKIADFLGQVADRISDAGQSAADFGSNLRKDVDNFWESGNSGQAGGVAGAVGDATVHTMDFLSGGGNDQGVVGDYGPRPAAEVAAEDARAQAELKRDQDYRAAAAANLKAHPAPAPLPGWGSGMTSAAPAPKMPPSWPSKTTINVALTVDGTTLATVIANSKQAGTRPGG